MLNPHETKELRPCRGCGNMVSRDAYIYPKCGAPKPALDRWDGYGIEYISKQKFLGLPLLHISFKYRDRKPVVAKGIIAIGQFGMGVINISQFGIGFISISQFTIAYYALAQFAIAHSAIAQIALVIDKGYGQIIFKLADILKNY
jgi:hypothetical protein